MTVITVQGNQPVQSHEALAHAVGSCKLPVDLIIDPFGTTFCADRYDGFFDIFLPKVNDERIQRGDDCC